MKSKIFLFSLTFLSYFLATIQAVFELQIIYNTLFWLIIFVLIGSNFIRFDIKPAFLKRKLFIWLCWIIAVFSLKKIGAVSPDIDVGFIIFFAYLPAVWLLKTKRLTHSFLALFFLLLLPFLLKGNYNMSAESVAILSYIFIVISLIQNFSEKKLWGSS